MNKLDIVSIVIPVYNVEEFIVQCIDSVLNQTYKKLEIIFVDDGSTDESGKICDKYALKDKRIKVIHKKNGGLSSARNAGLDYATGKYLMFLDSDDFLEENACEVLYNKIKQIDVDYVIGNYIYVSHKGEKYEEPMFKQDNSFELTIKNYDKSFFVMNSVVWNKIFKTDSIKKHKLKFLEGALAEDAIFTSYYYTHTLKGYYINDIILNYRQNEENKSITATCNINYFRKLNDAYKIIYNNYKETNNIEFYRFFCARIMPWFLCKIIDTNQLNKEEKKEVLQMFSWYFRQKDEYNVQILDTRLNNIIKNLNKNDIEEAIIEIQETKEYRENLNNNQKKQMYDINDELYKRMIKK